MLKYRGGGLIRVGFIGAVLMTLVILVGLSPDELLEKATSVRYQALFSEAGGLEVGNDVTVSGMKVGTVSNISLDHGDARVMFTVDGKTRIGADSTAHIRTGTLLGQRVLTLESAGSRVLRALETIPASRTFSPYALSDAIGDLAGNFADTDTASLNQSLDTLSATLDEIAPQLGPTFDGITRLSRTLNSRNEALRSVLKGAGKVSGILSERSQQVNALIVNASDLLEILAERRQEIAALLANTAAVASQLTGMVHDNEAQLAPTLARLNSITAMLQKNRDNIAKAMPGLAKYELTAGETVSGGYFYNAYVPNMFQMEFFQPIMDYMLGFRRGMNQGQPADTAGPRAEFPWPFNGIPGGSR